METTVEISYYPLENEYAEPVNIFLKRIKEEKLKIEIGIMSSVIIGEYSKVMQVLTSVMGELMEKYPSVFTLKISNTCPVK